MTKLLLSASISGGIIVLLWCLSYPLSKKIFNASWHYFILKTAMLFMLIPLSVLAPLFSSLSLSEKSVYSESEPESFTTHDIITVPPVYVEPDNAIQPVYEEPTDYEKSADPEETSNNTPVFNFFIWLSGLLLFVHVKSLWLAVAVILLLIETYRLHKFKRQILSISTGSPDSLLCEQFDLCRQQIGLRGKVRVKTSEYINTPLVTGLFKPIIILPAKEMSLEEKRFAILHELTHIKNGDLWFKLLASVISIVHWFNPFAHIL